ncbi:MAG: MFS transporter [Chloroherpetonaceae bacterium]|nr:MFS transporter [Chthonomonadaceae bacterium]MDW8207091.1 MFS transporter [Chloroherpetonaceae bacterium]
MNGSHERIQHMTQEQVNAAMRSLPGTPQRGPFYALTFPNFRLFFYGQTISVAGTWMQTVAQQWLVWQLTQSAFWLGLVSGANAVPFVLLTVWGGQVADRYPRQKVLACTQWVALLQASLLAVLATSWLIPIQAWHVTVLAATNGLINAFALPAQQALVPELLEDRTALSNAIALNSLRFNLARVLGPALAGVVLTRFDAATCFALNAVSYLAVILSLQRMRLPPPQRQPQHSPVWEGAHYLRSNPAILRVVALVGAGAAFGWSVATLYPAFAREFGTDAAGYSRMMTFNGIGAATGGLTLALLADRLPRHGMIFGGASLFAGALWILASAPSYPIALGSLVLSGFAMIVFGISSNTRVQEEAPDHLRGRVMAIYSLVFQGAMPVGGLAIGALASHTGIRQAVRIYVLLFSAAILIALTAFLSDRTQRHRQRS